MNEPTSKVEQNSKKINEQTSNSSEISSPSKSLIKSIKESLDLINKEKNEISDFEESKMSVTTSSSCSNDSFINSFEYFIFEENYKKYYVDSSENSNNNFDNYVKNALKLITLIPFNKIPLASKIKTISNDLYEKYNIVLSQKNNKKTLILDLDETLIHSDIGFLSKTKKYDIILQLFDDEMNKNVPLPIFLRPDLFEFLEYAYENFELILFTSSEQSYADTILSFIEKNKKYFSMKLYRDSCIFIEPGLNIKDLRIFSSYRKMEDIIIVDNSLFSFCNQLNNGILITSFFEDKNDYFLNNLKEYLKIIKDMNDIRELNKQSFKFLEYRHDIIVNSDNYDE